MSRNRPVALAAVLLVLGLLASACGSTKNVTLYAHPVTPPWTIATDSLTTDSGKPFELAKDTTAPLTLVFFGYTHCPDICPEVMSSITSGLRKLSAADQKKIAVLFVTSDPKRDTGPVLRAWLDRYSPKFVGLTGSLTSIAQLGKSVGIYVDQGQKLASGGYDPNSHSSFVIGVTDHKAPVFWDGDTAPSQFAHDFKFLLDHGTTHLESADS